MESNRVCPPAHGAYRGLLCMALLAGCSPPAERPAERRPERLAGDSASHAGFDGFGPVTFGMTPSEAAGALGVGPADSFAAEGCALWHPAGTPVGLSFMVENGRVVRLDVDSAGISTDAGVAVGTPVDSVRAAYGARVAESPHKYRWEEGWRYLTLLDPDSTHAMVFEVDSHRVRSFRAGLAAPARYVERCS
jgi:hypothetical protein